MTVRPDLHLRTGNKAKAETGVLVVERWILAALRDRTFFSLSELNRAIGKLLESLNNRPFQKLPGCRQELFQTLDQPALKPLPARPFEFCEWKRVRVHIDYHVEVHKHYYSVPYPLIKKQLDARITERTVECFDKGKRVASHARSPRQGGHTTVREHMPKSHQQYGDWSPRRLIHWAGETGPSAAKLIETLLSRKKHPAQGYRSALGILRLSQPYGKERLEAACKRALVLGTHRYRSLQSILSKGLDQPPHRPGAGNIARGPRQPPGPRLLPLIHSTLTGEPSCCIIPPWTNSMPCGSPAWPVPCPNNWTSPKSTS